MRIRLATKADVEILSLHDKHISKQELENLVYLSRGKGYGRQMVKYWEKEMQKLDFNVVMTSTASDEYAQHFYHKLGYKIIGGFTLGADPYEVILSKNL